MTDPGVSLQPYDFEAADMQIVGQSFKDQAEALVIATDEDDMLAKTVLAAVTKGLKVADARRVELKAPALAECRAIDDAFKTAITQFDAAKSIISKKAGDYFKAKRDAEDAARRESERIAREEAEKRAAAAAKAAEAAANRPADEAPADPEPAPEPIIAAVIPVPASAVTRTDAGTVGMVEQRGYQILDRTKIPIQFWTLDEKAIARVYRAGGDVPGCELVITYIPRTR